MPVCVHSWFTVSETVAEAEIEVSYPFLALKMKLKVLLAVVKPRLLLPVVPTDNNGLTY